MENEKVKYPIKSENYTGVYQRKNGKWFYRVKKINKNSKPVYYQRGGFDTDKIAYEAKIDRLKLAGYFKDAWTGEEISYDKPEFNGVTFDDFFTEFLNNCESQSAKEKYRSIYKVNLSMWKDRSMISINDSEIDLLLLKLSLEGRKQPYINAVRKMLKYFFKFARHLNVGVQSQAAQYQTKEPYKLRLLSLFSGIGAPEQALKDAGIDYELVNFCEIDKTAEKAYCLLHNVDKSKNLGDIQKVDFDYCNDILPDFDLMFFGFPCVNVSTQGNREGIMQGNNNHPPIGNLFFDDNIGELTTSGLFYRALQIAIWKRPKFMIAENVAALVGEKSRPDFEAMLVNIQDAGYNVYFDTLNSKDYGVPQNRDRVFMVMIRSDLNMDFKFPEPIPLTVRAEDWFEKDVADEYYITKKGNGKSEYWKPNYKTDVISCISTKWGGPYESQRQTLVEDKKGKRCLTSNELMRFQGFPEKSGDFLRENGISRNQVGHLVGNSITVSVVKAIFEQFFKCLTNQISAEIIPDKVVIAKQRDEIIQPLFAYMGNKSKLLSYMNYIVPINSDTYMKFVVFVDMFAGSGAVGINTKSERIILNEVDPFLINIYKGLHSTPPEKAWELVMEIVNKYNLSKENEDGYKKCKEDYNKIPFENRGDYWYWGLTLVYHSYNRNHVSHNKKGEFNSPFGWDKVDLEVSKKRFMPFAKRLYEGNFEFSCKSYKDFVLEGLCLDEMALYYFDPPYYASNATYNKDWKEPDEKELYELLDRYSDEGKTWLLSNVLENNGRRNDILYDWLKRNQNRYKIYFMKRDYKQSNYNRKNNGETLEVIVYNKKTRGCLPFEN